jgi:hypothetical protein
MPTVTGNIKRIAGSNVTSGQVRFTSTVPVVQDRTANTTTLGVAEHTVQIGSSGAISTTLPATGPDWVYEVEIIALAGTKMIETPILLLPVPAAGADLSDAGVKGQATGDVVVRQTVTAGELQAAVATAVAPVEAKITAAEAAAVEARQSVYRAEATVGEYEPRIHGIEVMAGIEPGSVTDGQTSNLFSNRSSLTWVAAEKLAAEVVTGHASVTGLRSDVTALQGRATALESRATALERRTPAYYGAKGDGTTDDTTALRAFLAAGHRVFDGGTYRTTAGLSLTGNGIHLEGNGTRIICDNLTRAEIIVVTGDDAVVTGFHLEGAAKTKANVTTNGKGDLGNGIRVVGARATITDNVITDIISGFNSGGIRVEGPGGNHITGNTVRNVDSAGSGDTGDGSAHSRGISLYHPGPATAGESTIAGNHIANILGQGAAGVSVLQHDGTRWPYYSAHATISGNTIENCHRRAVKIQASNVTVKGNTITDTITDTPYASASVIDVLDSDHVTITGNTVKIGELNTPIMVTAPSFTGSVGFITISDNELFMPGSSSLIGIYVTGVDQLTVSGNVIRGGLDGVRVGSISGGAVTNNDIAYQLSTGYSVYATANCTNMLIVHNTDTSNPRSTSNFFAQNNPASITVSGNIARTS